MTDVDISALMALAIIYAPLIVAGWGRGGGVWTFLTFLLCTLALAGLLFFVVPGVIAWLVAWGTAAAAHGAKRNDRILRELTKQKQQPRTLRDQRW
jgi:hypothetical protein